VLERIVSRGFELTHLLAYSVPFGRYTSMPETLAHLRRLRDQRKAWFCDAPGQDGCAPHAYLTLGVVGRRQEGVGEQVSEFLSALAQLLPAYQRCGPSVIEGASSCRS
jgi:hypothetical protein